MTPPLPGPDFSGYRIVITAAGRDFGRTLAIEFACRGATVFISARNIQHAERTRDEIRDLGFDHVYAFGCDLTDPASIRAFADDVSALTDRIDVLLNNGASYLDGDLLSVSDDDIVATIASAATGSILTTKHFLPLLLNSDKPDLVTMISACGVPGHERSQAHEAFYAGEIGAGRFHRHRV